MQRLSCNLVFSIHPTSTPHTLPTHPPTHAQPAQPLHLNQPHPPHPTPTPPHPYPPSDYGACSAHYRGTGPSHPPHAAGPHRQHAAAAGCAATQSRSGGLVVFCWMPWEGSCACLARQTHTQTKACMHKAKHARSTKLAGWAAHRLCHTQLLERSAPLTWAHIPTSNAKQRPPPRARPPLISTAPLSPGRVSLQIPGGRGLEGAGWMR